MTTDSYTNIEKLESDLWEAADNLRANSKLTSSDYFMPVLGVIFLRHAANRFAAATRQIEADKASGKMPKRKVVPADYVARRSLYLPEKARYDWIMQQASLSGVDLGALVNGAMTEIESEFEPLQGVLPKDYAGFESDVLLDLMRVFDRDQIREATGDVFGRIYEYFLAKFSIQKAHDNGEFFTPSSIVQTIVNVIEPDHGTVFDPACGSGGMFVQSSHFIEHEGGDTAKKVVFYGQEKNRDTIRIAKMNLAVHGLEGKIAEAITYYQDEHSLAGKCDFVMANPPFNVDLVDAEKVKGDPRLPFGLPGVNKQKKVGNGNYLWISYFWSYLNDKGRAGFVMSSQASTAAHGEKEVRRRIVESGDVDVMISIRGNFFYTRQVPCELWHFDRNKPVERKNKVLMIDARNIYRKVTRKIYDFSPEQMQNLAAIVWLYRGEHQRFLGLVKSYLSQTCEESSRVPSALAPFITTLEELDERFMSLVTLLDGKNDLSDESKRAVLAAIGELKTTIGTYREEMTTLLSELRAFGAKYARALPDSSDAQVRVRLAFENIAARAQVVAKQIDVLRRLASGVGELAAELAATDSFGAVYDKRPTARLIAQLGNAGDRAAHQLKQAVYFYRQALWLQDRFPTACFEAVPGLAKIVDRQEIEAADWSLSPGRHVGGAPLEESETFELESALRDIHSELADLNSEATMLGETVLRSLRELGA